MYQSERTSKFLFFVLVFMFKSSETNKFFFISICIFRGCEPFCDVKMRSVRYLKYIFSLYLHLYLRMEILYQTRKNALSLTGTKKVHFCCWYSSHLQFFWPDKFECFCFLLCPKLLRINKCCGSKIFPSLFNDKTSNTNFLFMKFILQQSAKLNLKSFNERKARSLKTRADSAFEMLELKINEIFRFVSRFTFTLASLRFL